MDDKVAIILVNYNGWEDTIECISSIYMNNYENFDLIIIDNGSKNNSIIEIEQWLNNYTNKIGINYTEVFPTRDSNRDFKKKCVIDSNTKNGNGIYFIKSNKNLGFAGGNNLGISFALQFCNCSLFWLLNNDTVIESFSLENLVETYNYLKLQKTKIGIIGSKIKYYFNRNLIQGVGGTYNKYTGISRHIGINELDEGQFDYNYQKTHIDYVLGVSMFFDIHFLEEVGEMNEGYFLYYEELDWAMRAKKNSYTLEYCCKSVIYHKEGSSIGSNSNTKKKSPLSEYFDQRNKVLFTLKFFPFLIGLVYFFSLLILLKRIYRMQWNNALAIVRGLMIPFIKYDNLYI